MRIMIAQNNNIRKLNVLNFLGQKEIFAIKKFKDNNEYCLSGQTWVRNFLNEFVPAYDINNLYSDEEIRKCIENEISNSKIGISNIETESFSFEKVFIVSSGFGFKENYVNLFQNININRNNVVFSVNNVPKLWMYEKRPQYYISSNFQGSNNFMFQPILVASSRSSYDAIKAYKNLKYFYNPCPNYKFQSPFSIDSISYIDDYRNPICASLGICSRFNVKEIYLAFCSEGYNFYKPGMNKVNDFYIYPEQEIANDIINKIIFWMKLKNKDLKIYYTGLKNSFTLAKYLETQEFIDMANYGK